jgi:hypothetical protein
MKRIREQTSSPDPVMARAASLLAAVRPLDPTRIRRGLPPVATAPRPRTMQVRVAFVLAVTLASAVAGAARLHRTGWLRLFWASGAGPSPAFPPAPAALAPVVRAPALHAAAPSPTLGPAEAPPDAGAVASPSAAHATPSTALRASSRDARDARPPVAVAEESALVVDAVRALRRDHDPKRAGSLAQEALQRYPQGAQVEEAMAVAMEAAAADGDSAAARRWAERYLGTFGTGRFADRARQLLAASPR